MSKLVVPIRPKSKLSTSNLFGIGLILLATVVAFKAQVLVWASNVAADSFAGFTGFSYRQGILLVIFMELLKTKVEANG